MPNTLKVQNFPAIYPLLNSLQTIDASRADITRSILAVGYPSRRRAFLQVGLWRARLLMALVRGYLKRDLSTTEYFRNLEQSEKAAMSFLLAQAFTHWFAERHMDLRYLVHVQGTSKWQKANISANSKPGAGPAKPRGRPDFIGWGSGSHHVFESKGRTRKGLGQSMKSALAQVSAIATVNGSSPATRVAACFLFGSFGVSGQIEDPADAPIAYDLVFDEARAVQKVYSFFLESDVQDSLSEEIPGFLSVRFPDDTIYGVDKETLAAVNALRSKPPRERRSSEVIDILDGKKSELKSRKDLDTSVGTDGTLVQTKETG